MEIELTRYTNVQLTMTWDTKQTMEQYDEIRENEPFDESEFFEYLVNNFVEWVRNSSDKEIRRELVILNDEGEVLD
jgi:hypothetical protein